MNKERAVFWLAFIISTAFLLATIAAIRSSDADHAEKVAIIAQGKREQSEARAERRRLLDKIEEFAESQRRTFLWLQEHNIQIPTSLISSPRGTTERREVIKRETITRSSPQQPTPTQARSSPPSPKKTPAPKPTTGMVEKTVKGATDTVKGTVNNAVKRVTK